DLSLEVFDGTNGDVGVLGGIEEVLAARVDGDAALGNDDVDEFGGAGEGGDFVDDDGNAVAERWQCEDGASGEEAVLPSADAVQKTPVAVRDDITVEAKVNLGCAEHNGVDHGGEVSFAVIVVGRERRGGDVTRV